jgi:hypothetical protein
MMTLFIIPILALIIFYSHTTIPQNIDTSIRADELQYFSESIGEDLMRFLQINGKRAIIAAVSMVITNGKGLNNAPASLAEMIENGTLNGTQPFADEKNLTTWEKNISDIAASQGFSVSFISALTVNVTQNDSFSILFNKTIYVNISDATTGMYILKNLSVAAAVSVESIEDPLYSAKTYWNVSVPIRRSPFNKNTTPVGEVWNLSNLTSDTINSYYFSSTKGASFLERLEGKFTLSKYQPYGLESFIYLPNMTKIYQPNTFSVLDYQYWANTQGYLLNYSQSYNPALDTQIYSWFRINCLAAADYNISSLLNTTC